MNRSRPVVLLCAATLSVPVCSAIAQSSKLFGMVAVGPAMPIGEFGNGFGTGWTLSASVGKPVANSPLAVRATASIGSFGESTTGGYSSSASSKPLSVTGDVMYRFGTAGAKVRPYAVAGVGLSSVGYSASYAGESGYSERDNGVMLGAGGGAMIERGSIAVFGEVRVNAIPGSGHSHVPVLVGVRFGAR